MAPRGMIPTAANEAPRAQEQYPSPRGLAPVPAIDRGADPSLTKRAARAAAVADTTPYSPGGRGSQ